MCMPTTSRRRDSAESCASSSGTIVFGTSLLSRYHFATSELDFALVPSPLPLSTAINTQLFGLPLGPRLTQYCIANALCRLHFEVSRPEVSVQQMSLAFEFVDLVCEHEFVQELIASGESILTKSFIDA